MVVCHEHSIQGRYGCYIGPESSVTAKQNHHGSLYIEGSLWHSNSIASGARGGDLDKDNQRIDKMRS